MDGLPQRRSVALVFVAVLGGLFVAAIGAIRTDPALLWGGLLLAGIAFVLGRPRDPEAAIDDRAEAFEEEATELDG